VSAPTNHCRRLRACRSIEWSMSVPDVFKASPRASCLALGSRTKIKHAFRMDDRVAPPSQIDRAAINAMRDLI
jgi:hypothetical protein